MAGKKISELTQETNVTGEELIPFVLDGKNKAIKSKHLLKDNEDVKNVFLVNEYNGNDYEKIQNAINDCIESGGGQVVLEGNYEVNDTIVLNADCVRLISYTSSVVLFLTDELEKPLFKITSSSTASGSDATCNCSMQGFTIKSNKNGTGVGIIFGCNNDEDYTSRDIKLRDIVITNFNIGVDYRKNAYLIAIEDSSISSCNICVQMLGGYSNYGERIVFFNTTLCNSALLIKMSNAEGIMYFTNCSLDYSTRFVENKGGNIFINGSHLEFRHLDTEQEWLIYCGGNSGHGSIVIRDSALICTNPGNEKYKYLFYCDSGSTWTDARYQILVDSCRIIHWKSSTGFLCGGNENGIFKLKNTYLNQIHNVDLKTKENNNLSKKIGIFSYDEETANVEIINQEVNGINRRVVKITKTTYLGFACDVKVYVPNIFGNNICRFYMKREGTGTTSCWLTYDYRYGNLEGGVLEIPPSMTEYKAEGLTGYHFINNMTMDDLIFTFNLSNAETNDVFYFYISELYEY